MSRPGTPGRTLFTTNVCSSTSRISTPTGAIFTGCRYRSSAATGSEPHERRLRERFGHRRIDQGAQVAAQGQSCLAADHLGHEDDRQLFPGIDPEGGRRGTTPEIFAERAGQAGLGDVDVDPAAERKADTGIARLAEHSRE